jgi:phosphohistidine phosphatase
MKKLIFVRHAKAEAEEEIPGLSDFERSLTPNGKLVAREMAKHFLKREASPGLIVSSPAFRALETAMIFAGEAGSSYEKITLCNSLYLNTNLERVLKLLSGLSDDIKVISLFGHNPSFSDIPDRLSSTGCSQLPKSGVACLTFDTDNWSGVGPKKGRLEYLLKPSK